MKIIVKSNGKQIGTLTCDQFRSGVSAPKFMFLPEIVERWNAHKEEIGEPERVEISIEGASR